MRNRLVLWIVLPIAAGFAGCATTPRTGTGTPTFGPQAWNQAPAPPQRTVATTVPSDAPAGADVLNPTAQPTGLSKYFPGLQRPTPDAPKLVARYRPTWFGLRPNPSPVAKPAMPTTYMTDARAGLSRTYADLATLPVSLQVPPPSPSADGAVKPAAMQQPIGGSSSTADSSGPELPVTKTSTSAPAPTVADFGGKRSKPGEDEINPLPPAIEPSNSPVVVASRMPEVPPVDPQDTPKPAERAPTPPAPPVVESAPALTPAPAPPAQNPVSNPVPAPTLSSPTPPATGDDKTVQAIPPVTNPNLPPNLPEPTVPASYASVVIAQQSVGNFKKHFENKVYASPQVAPKPTPQAMPRPQVKATPQVAPTSQSPVPTSLTKPSPQATPSAQSCEDPAATEWKRPCLRRLVRKVCKLGEYANPPTAAPH